jgi:hypothetical protein
MVNLVNMPVSRKEMEKYQNRHVRQIEHMAKQWQARESKVANNAKRKEWMERQNNANYRNEYDRIRNYLEHSRIPFGNPARLKLAHRRHELERLFSSGNV